MITEDSPLDWVWQGLYGRARGPLHCPENIPNSFAFGCSLDKIDKIKNWRESQCICLLISEILISVSPSVK